MADKPRTSAEYTSEHVELVRSTCLYVATKLGDLMDELVVIGGLVPSLLVQQDPLPEGADAHVGTMDLDVGLTLTIFDEGRYKTLAERLRLARFEPDVKEGGKITRQRWKIEGPEKITIDFLIPPSQPGDRAGKLRNFKTDFAAFISPGVQFAFLDREEVVLEGKTIMGEQAKRSVWVCGPGAYVLLKSLAFRNRGENKDAYDLYYLVRNFGAGVEDVAERLQPLLSDPLAELAISYLRDDFLEHSGVGPRRVAEFLTATTDDRIQADVVGYIEKLLELVGE